MNEPPHHPAAAPPPPGRTAPQPQPPQQIIVRQEETKRGMLGGLTRLGGLFTFAILLFFLGFYVAVFYLQADRGPSVTTFRDGEGRRQIAIIPIRGLIDRSTVGFTRSAVKAVLDDPNIRAVVVRVESPGGGATASDEILQELQRLREEGGLPVVASYGDYAASGGYYVSVFADHIYAQPTTVTGSIGVIAPYFTIHEMLEKIGIEPQVMTSTAATDKDTGSMFRPWTEEDRRAVRDLLDAIQDRFVTVVAEGRQGVLTREQVLSLATGRGLMADEALDLKLIDEIGYIGDALERARDMGDFDVPNPPAVIFRPRPGLGALVGLNVAPQRPEWPTDPETARRWLAELSVPRMMYLFQP